MEANLYYRNPDCNLFADVFLACIRMGGGRSMIYKEEGWRALFLGLQPRVMWIGIGGFVFFGAYEKSKEVLTDMEDDV